MPRDLFGDVTRPSISIGNRKWYTVPVSLLSHAIVLAMIVIVPILAAPYMPGVIAGAMPNYIPIVDPPPPALPPKQPDLKPPANPDAFPRVVPDGITKEIERPDDFNPIDIPVGTIGGDPNIDRVLTPPPVVKPPAAPPEPVRAHTLVRAPMKTRHVDPIYPPIAQAARVQGIVIIEATISPEGKIVNARILRSVPLLDQAALDAVRQWEFTPSQLNGVPVPVIMTVTVQFTLSR